MRVVPGTRQRLARREAPSASAPDPPLSRSTYSISWRFIHDFILIYTALRVRLSRYRFYYTVLATFRALLCRTANNYPGPRPRRDVLLEIPALMSAPAAVRVWHKRGKALPRSRPPAVPRSRPPRHSASRQVQVQPRLPSLRVLQAPALAGGGRRRGLGAACALLVRVRVRARVRVRCV